MFDLKEFWQKFRKALSQKINLTEIPWLSKIKQWDRLLIGLLFFILLTFIMSVNLFPQKINLETGQVAEEDVFADKTVHYTDEAATNAARDEAEKKVEDVYIIDSSVAKQISEKIDSVLTKLQNIINADDMDATAKQQAIAAALPFAMSDNAMQDLLSAKSDDVVSLQKDLTSLLQEAYKENISSDDLENVHKSILDSLASENGEEVWYILADGLLSSYLQANYYLDEEKTEALKAEAREAVEPIQKTIQKGQKIIGVGDIVTDEHLAELEQLGLMKPHVPFSKLLGIAILVLISMTLILIYIYLFRNDLYKKITYLMLTGIIVLLVILIARGLLAINFSKLAWFSEMAGYMVPVGAASLMIAILVDRRLSILITAILALLISQITEDNRMGVAIVAFVSGLSGVLSLKELNQRSELVRAGLYVAGSSFIAILAVNMISEESAQMVLLGALVMGALNGFLTSVLTIGIMPYLENIFGITSSIKLLELINPGHPLLKQLLLEAPGTYHHSVMVGNLSEAACDVIGGDNLIVRAGAYFHDIGNIKRPYFFIENQMSDKNPHDDLPPDMSALILTCHIRDGVELALKYGLPQVIIDIIRQHHGTSLTSFFYQKALESGQSVNEAEFHYEGPKPQTKEAAIVMLADSVEAAVRSMKSPTMDEISEMVDKIIRKKLNDRQLDEADITMRELDEVQQAFMNVLQGIFHKRIEYPDYPDIIKKENEVADTKGSEE